MPTFELGYVQRKRERDRPKRSLLIALNSMPVTHWTEHAADLFDFDTVIRKAQAHRELLRGD